MASFDTFKIYLSAISRFKLYRNLSLVTVISLKQNGVWRVLGNEIHQYFLKPEGRFLYNFKQEGHVNYSNIKDENVIFSCMFEGIFLFATVRMWYSLKQPRTFARLIKCCTTYILHACKGNHFVRFTFFNSFHLQVLDYVASMLEITKEELAELSYQNAVRLFSYEGSKILQK